MLFTEIAFFAFSRISLICHLKGMRKNVELGKVVKTILTAETHCLIEQLLNVVLLMAIEFKFYTMVKKANVLYNFIFFFKPQSSLL